MNEPTIPYFNNWSPFYEMLFRGLLSAKTRQDVTWHHVGPTILRTSTKVASDARRLAEAYGLDYGEIPRGAFVGVGTLMPVRRNTKAERDQLNLEFRDFFGAGNMRFEFEDLRRFPEPIYFSEAGPVNFGKISLTIVKDALVAVGLDPQELMKELVAV